MNHHFFLPVTHAASEENSRETIAVTGQLHSPVEEHNSALKIDPAVVAFQAFNFLLLLIILNFILYKPLLKLLKEREQRIAEGVENAQKADAMVKESNLIRVDMIKNAKTESQTILELARKSAEKLKLDMLTDAKNEAEKIVDAGQNLLEIEKAKALQDLKVKTTDLIVLATEKILKEKIDAKKNAQFIHEALKNYSR